MDLTPRDIQQKQFADTFRGYSHEEVDAFLDEVAESFSRMYRENQNLVARLRSVEQELGQAKQTEDMLKRTLLQAQKTVDDTIAEARRKAQEIEGEAGSRASAIVAEAQAKQIEVRETIEALRRYEREYRERLKSFMEAQLQVLGGPSVAPAREPAPPPPTTAPQPSFAPAQPADSGPAVMESVSRPATTSDAQVAAPAMAAPSMVSDPPRQTSPMSEAAVTPTSEGVAQVAVEPEMEPQPSSASSSWEASPQAPAPTTHQEAAAAINEESEPSSYQEQAMNSSWEPSVEAMRSGPGITSPGRLEEPATAGREVELTGDLDGGVLGSPPLNIATEQQPDYPSPAPETPENPAREEEPERPRVKEDEKSISELFWGEE